MVKNLAYDECLSYKVNNNLNIFCVDLSSNCMCLPNFFSISRITIIKDIEKEPFQEVQRNIHSSHDTYIDNEMIDFMFIFHFFIRFEKQTTTCTNTFSINFAGKNFDKLI